MSLLRQLESKWNEHPDADAHNQWHNLSWDEQIAFCNICAQQEMQRERDAMLAAITVFCAEQRWTSETYKEQPHIKPLFDIYKKGQK